MSWLRNMQTEQEGKSSNGIKWLSPVSAVHHLWTFISIMYNLTVFCKGRGVPEVSCASGRVAK
jgi:hypothetical protein